MGRRDEIERRLDELIEAAEWHDVIPRVQAYARTYLSRHGEQEGRRWNNVTRQYVERAVEMLVEKRAACARFHKWETLHQLLCCLVAQLIDDDEGKIRRMLETAKWNDIIPRVIAHTIRQLGPRTGTHGKSPEDYVYDAVLQLFQRRRHFPIDREVSLFTFLCNTVHGMRTNDRRSGATEGQHVTIVNAEHVSSDELSANRIASPSPDALGGERFLLERLDGFIDSLDDELRPYARLRVDGRYETAQDYASALNVPVKTIRNYDRRLRRLRQRWDQR
jgi:hypothetical protein